MDPLDHLHAHGYVVLRNVLTQDQVEWGVGAIRGGEVQYDRMRRFIDEHMMAAINEQMRWRVQYVKYRVSDNNNSADASTFHRDLMCKDADVAVPIPVFTCLTYFDATTMELIPNSHRELATGYWRAFRMFSERVQVTIHPGDLLVFYATLLHRGVFTDTQAKNRRLIQVFDSFANDADYQALAPRIVHVPGDETHSNMMIALSKRPWAIAPLNMYGYLNAATGYGGLQVRMVGRVRVRMYCLIRGITCLYSHRRTPHWRRRSTRRRDSAVASRTSPSTRGSRSTSTWSSSQCTTPPSPSSAPSGGTSTSASSPATH
jgi:hypothetical protein